MTKRELRLWEDALWLALDELHCGPNRWVIWNDVDAFFIHWLQEWEGRRP
jgi:hypothetical protein